jgi:FeS assembly SUF system protein
MGSAVESKHDLDQRETATGHRITHKVIVKMESINETIIEAQVIEALRSCFDPEIPVNIYELGLVYDVKVGAEGTVTIQMTLTSPHCPAVQSLPAEIEGKVKTVAGVTDVKIDLVWDPPWDPSKMSEAARLQLGMM